MIKWAPIAAAANGDNPVVAAVPGRRIGVVAFRLSFSGNVNARWTDGLAGGTLDGLYYGAAGVQVPAPPLPWVGPSGLQPQFATAAGNPLVLNLSAATAVGGWVGYIEMT